MVKNFIVCLTGLPASGKTTFAEVLRNIIKEKFNSEKVKIVDPDIIRKQLSPIKFNHKFEPEVRKSNLKEIRNNLLEGNIVISDDLNYYTSMRHDLKALTDEFNILFFIVHISTPLKVCLKWNKARGKPIPNEIIKDIKRKFDNFNKYTWDRPETNYNMSQIQDLNEKIKELVELFFSKVNSHERLIEGMIKKDSNEQNEYLDKITRDYVGKLLQNSKFMAMKKNFIKARKLFVKSFKNQNLKENDIPQAFIDFLEKKLGIIISQDFI